MKKTLLLCLALLSAFGLSAQFERVISKKGYAGFVKTLGGDYAFVFKDGEAGVLDYRANNKMILDITPPAQCSYVFDLVDSSIVFKGLGLYYDLGGWWGYFFYRKFDSQLEEEHFPNNLWSDAPNTEKMADGGFVDFHKGSSYFIRYGHDAEILWDASFPNLAISDVATNQYLQTLAAGSQGLWVVDENGEVDTIRTDLIFTHLETDSFGNLAGAKSDTIFLFSIDFQLLAKAPIPGQTVKDMKFLDHQLAVLSTADHVFLFDQNLLPIGDFQLTESHLEFKNIVPDSGGVVLAGEHYYGISPNSHRTAFLKKYGTDGFDPFADRDAGLKWVQDPTSTEVWQQGGYYHVRFHDVQFTVYNYSDTVMTSVRANVRFPSLPPIPQVQLNETEQHFFKDFTGLSVQPGGNTALTWGEITARFVDPPSGTTLDLCFWSSLPDGKTDVVRSNDVACAEFYVANETVAAPVVSFSASPNPTKGNFQVAYSIGNIRAEVEVRNLIGQTLERRATMPGSGRFDVSLPNAGIYFVVLRSNGETIAQQKLVVAP